MKAERRAVSDADSVPRDQGRYQRAGRKAVSIDHDPLTRIANCCKHKEVCPERPPHVAIDALHRMGRMSESDRQQQANKCGGQFHWLNLASSGCAILRGIGIMAVLLV